MKGVLAWDKEAGVGIKFVFGCIRFSLVDGRTDFDHITK